MNQPAVAPTPREPELAGPRKDLAWRESRALLDAARMTLPLLLPAGAARARRPRTIVVLPGFGANDHATWPLRRWLAKLGHRVEGWGLGLNRAGVDIPHTLADLSPGWDIEPVPTYRNEASVPMLCDRMVARTRARHAELGAPITLIGWSLGGVVAREVARDLPGIVEEVITLGTPVQGGPKYTRAAAFFRARGMDLDWIEREVRKRDERRPLSVPVTVIASPSDAVVGHAATRDLHSTNVRHLDIDAAHLGLVFNPTVWRMISETLNRRD